MCFSLLAEVFLLLFSSVPSSQRWNGVKLSPRCVLFPTQKHLRSEVFAEVLGFFLCQIRYCRFKREYIIRLGSFLWSSFSTALFFHRTPEGSFFRSLVQMIETSFFQTRCYKGLQVLDSIANFIAHWLTLNWNALYCFRPQAEAKIPRQQFI